MTDSEMVRVVALLDEARAELRCRDTLDLDSWRQRYPDLADELLPLLETLRNLDTAADDWKGEPRSPDTTEDGVPAAEAVAEPLPEHIGRYRLLARLGQGGMGTVYKAHDPQLNRTVAVKVPRFDRERPDHGVAVQRFLREARLAAGVRHAHVCPVHDVGEHDGSPFVVMAFIEGQTLAYLCKERLEASRAVELVRKVALGLEAVHAQELVHRDLKPANILIDGAGEPLLSDFGLARPVTDEEHLTKEGAVVGTPAFMAPEQAMNEPAKIGPWTDVYSLGVVLYQLLTGRQPFDGPPLTMLYKIAHEVPPTPSQLRPDLDPALEAIVLKMMARRPEERYQNARQVIEALDGWRTPTLPAPRPPRRRGWVVAAALALFVAGAALLAGQIIIRLKGSDGKVTEVTVPEGSKVGIDDKGNVNVELPGGQKPPPAGAGPVPAGEKSGDPLSPGALVQRPTRLHGLRGWTIDTRGNRCASQHRPILSPDGRLLATGSYDGSIRITDAETGNLVKILHGHTERLCVYGHDPHFVAWSADGKSLASHSLDNTLRVWDIPTGRLRQTFTDTNAASLAWSPDGKLLAACVSLGEVRLLEVSSGAVGSKLHASGPVGSHGLAWSPDGKQLATGSLFDGKIQV